MEEHVATTGVFAATLTAENMTATVATDTPPADEEVTSMTTTAPPSEAPPLGRTESGWLPHNRVKVYVLSEEQWQDAGTGHLVLSGQGSACSLEVLAEDDGKHAGEGGGKHACRIEVRMHAGKEPRKHAAKEGSEQHSWPSIHPYTHSMPGALLAKTAPMAWSQFERQEVKSMRSRPRSRPLPEKKSGNGEEEAGRAGGDEGNA